MSWDTPDIRKLIEQLRKLRDEATVSANVGAFQVPIGGVLRDAGLQKGYQQIAKRRKKLKK